MLDIVIDTLIDSIKLFPFLLLAFMIIELIEHKLNKKSKEIISKSEKFGPLIGSILGAFPQCGFSVVATNLYITRIISLGTLIAIYLSTSDEMLPILISKKANISIIISIIVIKILIGIISGFIIDLLIKKKDIYNNKNNYEICSDEHCHCDRSILTSAIVHTVKTLFFLMIITFILNVMLHNISSNNLSKIFMKNNIFAPLLASLIGLVPNCASSIMITELYLNNAISFSSTIAGLLTGSGVALLVLFKANKNLKENLKILGMLYFIGSFSGILLQILENLG